MTTQGIQQYISKIDAQKLVQQVLFTLFAVQVFMIFADVFFNFFDWISYGELQRSFNITREDSIQNWFAVVVTGSIAVTLYFIHFLRTKGIPEIVTGLHKATWLLFGIFFTYLSMDDGSRLHERVGGAVEDAFLGSQNLLDILALQTFPSYAWQIVYVPGLALCFVLFFFFVGKMIYQKAHLRHLFMAASFLVMAVVFDFVEGLDRIFNPELHFLKLIEESMEVSAMILILYVLLSYVVDLLYREQ